jgi:hypothetical protein
MPVFAEGSTTKMPAHSEEAMPCVAEMADILSDPGVCWVALLSSAGRTTLMIDDALGLDNPRIAISSLHGETIGQLPPGRANRRVCFPCTLRMVPLDSWRANCTVLYSTHEMLDSNL